MASTKLEVNDMRRDSQQRGRGGVPSGHRAGTSPQCRLDSGLCIAPLPTGAGLLRFAVAGHGRPTTRQPLLVAAGIAVIAIGESG